MRRARRRRESFPAQSAPPVRDGILSRMVEQFDLSTEKGIAAVYVNGGALNLYSGTLSQNKGYYGGAVSVRYNGNANLFGGTISGNTAPPAAVSMLLTVR